MNSYKIYLDGELIYYSGFDDEKYTIISPTLTMEMNKSGSFEFLLPKENLAYLKEIIPLKTLINIQKDDSEFWRGRVISIERDFYLNRRIVCEGELGYLNDYSFDDPDSLDYSKKPIALDDLMVQLMAYQVPRNFERTLAYAYSNTGSDVKNYKFSASLDLSKSLLDNILDVISNFPVFIKIGPDRNVGEPPSRYPNGVGLVHLYSLKDKDFQSNQVIEFGKNLLDLNEFIDANSIVNAVSVWGKKKSNGNRYSITRAVPYEYSDEGFSTRTTGIIQYDPSVNVYGYIVKTLVFDNLTKMEDLEKEAIDYLKKTFLMNNSIEISAIDLGLLSVDSDEFEVGQFVRIKSDPHGIDTNTICSKIVMDFENPENNQYTFGLLYKSLSEQQANSDKMSTEAYNAAMGFVWQEKETT